MLDRIHKAATDLRNALLPAVDHYLMLEKPKEFNEKLRDVLKGLAKK